jgi:hypothetical protein
MMKLKTLVTLMFLCLHKYPFISFWLFANIVFFFWTMFANNWLNRSLQIFQWAQLKLENLMSLMNQRHWNPRYDYIIICSISKQMLVYYSPPFCSCRTWKWLIQDWQICTAKQWRMQGYLKPQDLRWVLPRVGTTQSNSRKAMGC